MRCGHAIESCGSEWLECFGRYNFDYIGLELARTTGAINPSLSLIAQGTEFAGHSSLGVVDIAHQKLLARCAGKRRW